MARCQVQLRSPTPYLRGMGVTAHVYFSVLLFVKGVILLTFGTREENLARIEDAYAAVGWKLVDEQMVQTG